MKKGYLAEKYPLAKPLSLTQAEKKSIQERQHKRNLEFNEMYDAK
jgi:hypothetical protein